MLTVTIGDIIGMSHETRYTRDGRPVTLHRPHRALTTSLDRFHLGGPGTLHLMRPYVVEYSDRDAWSRFRWETRCGQQWLYVEADGRCAQAPSQTDDFPVCHHCQTCERLVRREAERREWRSRVRLA